MQILETPVPDCLIAPQRRQKASLPYSVSAVQRGQSACLWLGTPAPQSAQFGGKAIETAPCAKPAMWLMAEREMDLML